MYYVIDPTTKKLVTKGMSRRVIRMSVASLAKMFPTCNVFRLEYHSQFGTSQKQIVRMPLGTTVEFAARVAKLNLS